MCEKLADPSDGDRLASPCAMLSRPGSQGLIRTSLLILLPLFACRVVFRAAAASTAHLLAQPSPLLSTSAHQHACVTS
jgi:hypothetical protein